MSDNLTLSTLLQWHCRIGALAVSEGMKIGIGIGIVEFNVPLDTV